MYFKYKSLTTMKKFMSLFIALFATVTLLFAQEEGSQNMQTLFGGPNVQSVGGYGALQVGYTKVNSMDALLIGARGAVVLNHGVALGLGGQGFITEPQTDVNLNDDYDYTGGYGGIYIEPIVGWRHPVHLSFPVLIGAGGIGYVRHWADYEDNQAYTNYDEDSYAFFVLEPGVELEFNMLKFMRLALSANYRYTSDIKLNYKERFGSSFSGQAIGPSDMLRGFNFGMVMKFGKF
jgi:hypothetical protein